MPVRDDDRVSTLRDSLRADAARGELSPLPAALQSPLMSKDTPTALQTPRSDAMRRLVAATSMQERSLGMHSVFDSPMQRALRQAPLGGSSPACSKRPLKVEHHLAHPTKARRSLGATLGERVVDAPGNPLPRQSLLANLGTRPTLCASPFTQQHMLRVSETNAQSGDRPPVEQSLRGPVMLSPFPVDGSSGALRGTSGDLSLGIKQSLGATADHGLRVRVPRSGSGTLAEGVPVRLRSRSPPAQRRHPRTLQPGLPPLHDRPPAALSRTPSLSGYRATTPTAASPTQSVSTPAGLRPRPLQVPGAPMKKSREHADPDDLLGRISSLSVDSLDVSALSLPPSNTPDSPPRELSTRRVLLFDDLVPGEVP